MYAVLSNWSIFRKKIIIIVIPDKEERQLIHQYLEMKYPQMKKSSLRLENFYSELYGKCYECDHLVLVTCHQGSMKNNQDEYASGTCDYCGSNYFYEWHYDDDHEYKPYPVNNVIAIGDYFDHYTKSCYHTRANCFDVKECVHSINKYQIFIVNAPTNQLRKTKLGAYINTHLYDIQSVPDKDKLFEFYKICGNKYIARYILYLYFMIYQ